MWSDMACRFGRRRRAERKAKSPNQEAKRAACVQTCGAAGRQRAVLGKIMRHLRELLRRRGVVVVRSAGTRAVHDSALRVSRHPHGSAALSLELTITQSWVTSIQALCPTRPCMLALPRALATASLCSREALPSLEAVKGIAGPSCASQRTFWSFLAACRASRGSSGQRDPNRGSQGACLSTDTLARLMLRSVAEDAHAQSYTTYGKAFSGSLAPVQVPAATAGQILSLAR